MLTDCLNRNNSGIHTCPNRRLPFSFKEKYLQLWYLNNNCVILGLEIFFNSRMPTDLHNHILPAVSTTFKTWQIYIMIIVTLILLWMNRELQTSIQHKHITWNNSTAPFLRTHTVAPVSHWPWLESLGEQAALSQHEAITSWLGHDRCEPSSFLQFCLAQWDSSRFPAPEPERSSQLQINCPQGYLLCFLIFAVYLSLSVIIQRRMGQGTSSCERMSCCS